MESCNFPRSLLSLSSLLVALAFAGHAAATTGVMYPTLPQSFVVNTQVNGVEVLADSTAVMVYNQDTLTVTWRLNETFVGQDSAYLTVISRLCYAAVSAKNRGWRAANPDLLRDKTCYTTINTQAYPPSTNITINGVSLYTHTFNWVAPNNIPGAFYFVRVFALNSSEPGASAAWNAVATGQSSNASRTTNIVQVVPYSGVTTSLDITIIVLSIAAYALLFGIFFAERWMKKNK